MSSVIVFDRGTLTQELDRLGPAERIAFGAAASERLVPYFERFVREASGSSVVPLRTALDWIWAFVMGSPIPPMDTTPLMASVKVATPHSDDHPIQSVDGAISAGSAVWHTLKAIPKAEPALLATVGKIARDAVDTELLLYGRIPDLPRTDPDLKERIDRHPLMQKELLRQTKDISALAAGENLRKFMLRSKSTSRT